jgi:oligoribonuclease (3'-5' exoribonuclease)
VFIDIETTGLNPDPCDIIEIGAVIDDWLEPLELQPLFHCYIKQQQYKGEPYALSAFHYI